MDNHKDLIFETQYWKIFLMPDQAYLGRCVVVLKRQCGDLAELFAAEITDFFDIVKKLENAFKKAYGATMFNWSCLMNNAYQNTPPDPQVHWHFRPRYEHPVEISRVTFTDPEFGYHYDHNRKIEVGPEIRAVIIESIVKNM